MERHLRHDKIDKFFDTLNVSSFTSGKHHRKPFQDPIRGPSDFRMKVCVWLTLEMAAGRGQIKIRKGAESVVKCSPD